jgi:peptide/nickel transport system substrate-binding protein
MFKIAQVAEANLTEAGFKVDLQVMDWATLLQRRNDASIWEAFVTSRPIFPDPTLFSPFNRNYAGWWDTPGSTQPWKLSPPPPTTRRGWLHGRRYTSCSTARCLA